MNQLLARAIDLAPQLRDASDEANRLRRLPDATWNALLDSGLLRGLQPVRWGGAEAEPAQFFEAIAEIARVDGSAGWVSGIIGVHPWQLALFPKETQDEVWGEDPATMHSSSYAPTGKAEKVKGGFRLNGRWSFSTGCDHCQWVNLGAIAGGVEVQGVQVPDSRSFMLPRRDYIIDDNWHVAGLRGTGSKDIVVDNPSCPTTEASRTGTTPWAATYPAGRSIPRHFIACPLRWSSTTL